MVVFAKRPVVNALESGTRIDPGTARSDHHVGHAVAVDKGFNESEGGGHRVIFMSGAKCEEHTGKSVDKEGGDTSWGELCRLSYGVGGNGRMRTGLEGHGASQY